MKEKIVVLKNSQNEGPGTLAEYLSGFELEILDLWDGAKLPAELEGIRALIALGGPMNVYETEKYPFLDGETVFIRDAVLAGLPYLGICLGAQLLAKAFGAKVRKNHIKEIGWGEVSLTLSGKKDPLFAGVKERFTVFQMHEDTFEIPKGADNLAGSIDCINQALKYGENSYGFQFHLEADADMVSSWLERPKTSADILHAEAARRTALIIYSNFSKLIASRAISES